jgi:hypothetical protein
VSASSLGSLVGSDRGGDVDGETIEAERSEHVLSVGVDLEATRSRGIEGRDVRDVLVLALSLLLLQLEGDTTDGTSLNSLHQVRGEAGNLVAKSLGGDNSNLIDDSLVLVEVDVRETRVVFLDEHSRGSLGGLGTNSTLIGGKEQ